ncbi:hypothetical protein EDC02_5907 [Micromonospora sp. Llam0]|uniref:hypothetical protein n=1 Tax=Micromonospora sp. Llam0 TaxID=2485143 RepID=UPI000FBAB573|nr:hypothetical protein [Micromonospora sp. Llam0]ROO51043.1 hypothetical protein EDC02_5907 [Micromonospora sp. Llam0]
MIRRLWWRATTTCAQWPCRRCDRAGRYGWRERQRWHDARRDCRWSIAAAALVASPFAVIVVVMALVGELTR